MWSFLVFFIIVLFVISHIVIKITWEGNKIPSGIKTFFKILVFILIIFISVYILILITDVGFSIFIGSILEVFFDFLRGFGF